MCPPSYFVIYTPFKLLILKGAHFGGGGGGNYFYVHVLLSKLFQFIQLLLNCLIIFFVHSIIVFLFPLCLKHQNFFFSDPLLSSSVVLGWHGHCKYMYLHAAVN